MGEGPLIPVEAPGDWKGGSTAVAGPAIAREKRPAPGEADFRFTVAKDTLYAFGYVRPAVEAKLVSLAAGKAKVERVTLLGSGAPMRFKQTGEALRVTLPAAAEGSSMPYGMRIEGSMPLGVS
jgi:alpha-L-fucosidase